ncbi:hypothetical protein C5167_001579 [Papaver somniferum]|uniref:Uncharacterized protein n=1 Tax=Papaver somniferum TaxID=3469 RepID=A0A4Y7KZC4_PAPSO|nr:hypothetical protein C5167_001579 [Papaver somniferum]
MPDSRRIKPAKIRKKGFVKNSQEKKTYNLRKVRGWVFHLCRDRKQHGMANYKAWFVIGIHVYLYMARLSNYEDGIGYVEIMNLDRETNLKLKGLPCGHTWLE